MRHPAGLWIDLVAVAAYSQQINQNRGFVIAGAVGGDDLDTATSQDVETFDYFLIGQRMAAPLQFLTATGLSWKAYPGT